MKRFFRAFTLTELLVVIGILAVLAAILLPVFFSARAKARTAACAANLRQIGNGLQNYLQDYDGTYPPFSEAVFVGNVSRDNAVTWRDLLMPYTKWFPHCPDRNNTRPPQYAQGPSASGYAYNYYLSQAIELAPARTAEAGIPENAVKTPALTISVFDARDIFGSLGKPDTRANKIPGDTTPGAERHEGGANYLFADGHVKWFVPDGLTTSEKGDGLHPGFGL